MIQFLFLLAAAALPLWGQAEGRYRYAAISVKTGVAFQPQVKTGEISVVRQNTPRFIVPHPAGAGRTLQLAASPTGDVIAGAAGSSTPELFVALRASAEPGPVVALAQGEWSAVTIDFEGGKARGLRTSFTDFVVAGNGAISRATRVSHEASVDDVCRGEDVAFKLGEGGLLEIDGVKNQLTLGAAGDMFLAVSGAPAHSAFTIAVRRFRDGNTMSMRGAYAFAEIGARNSFAFAPDQAKFFSGLGTLEASGGQARIWERLALADSVTQFAGSSAYMVSLGAGTFSPRLEQRRRNLAMGADGALFITAQVAEAGQLSLLHGVGIGLRTMDPPPPSVAARATAQGNVVSLYGQHLDGAQVLIGGQPAAIVQAWPNQVNVKLAEAPTSPLSVELDGPAGRVAAVKVGIGSALPEFGEAPAAPGGLIAPEQAAAPGETIELGITGGALPTGAAVLFDGIAGDLVSSALVGGLQQIKVMLPKSLVPAGPVNVAVAAPGYYVDLGDITVNRPRVTNVAPAAAASH